MRVSKAFIRTQKEDPADASGVSHVLLTRAGYIRKIGAGIYDFMPLGLRVLRKIEAIVREEMNASGAQEVLLPTLLPAEYFQESGRFDGFGDTLLRLKDRKSGDYHLGPTHEEIITDLVRREVNSYRDLPINLYQVQTKYRDEPRPRAGLLRCREFLMKDAYSFDLDQAGAEASYETMRKAYCNIFDRLQLDYRMVAADSGAMGGNKSAEFQVLVQSGEDFIAVCENSDYAANLEVASATDPRAGAKEPPPAEELVKEPTPGTHSIEQVAGFFKISPKKCLKSLVYRAEQAEGEPLLVMAILRGDHELNEIKLARALGVVEVTLASEADVRKAVGVGPGSVGPVGFEGTVVVDRNASMVANGVCGANEAEHHYKGLTFGRDYEGQVGDIRNVVNGDRSPDGKGKLKLYRGIEAGHIFILGTHYSDKMGAKYLAEDGVSRSIVMGCYGIGVSRLVATAIEQHHDKHGIRWPINIAPYQVHLITLGSDEPVMKAAEELVKGLEAEGVEVLWDDRDERPGVKFKDADLLGMPIRLTLGGKGLAKGIVEYKRRDAENPKAFDAIPIEGSAKAIAERVRAAQAEKA